jgi:hypothetical protein
MDGIEIPRDVADAEGVPDDLDSSAVGPYVFPSPTRRSTAAVIYLVAALLAGAAALGALSDGFWLIALAFLAIAAIHRFAAHALVVDQGAALDRAGSEIDFAVGHASAALAFVGWRARPIWNVILYAATEPPDRRALVQIDATTGELVADTYEEPLSPEFIS